MDCLLQVDDVSFPQVKEFEYLQVLFMSAGMMKHKVSITAPNRDEVGAEPEGSHSTGRSLFLSSPVVMRDGS